MKVGIFKTDWGWMGIGATPRGVATIILPKRTRRAVECELLGFANGRAAMMTQSSARNIHDASDAMGHQEGEGGGEGQSASRHLRDARELIQAYLGGETRRCDLPLDLDGQPTFRKKVWGVLTTIPYGRVRSYGWVAKKIGKPLAARAVGGACGANPLPLIVPCHRVVAGNGSLGGFAGGLPVKKRLLRLEGILLQK
jgi:methylated-DNA-[protein]-cysteine S-methyltransferase